MATGILYDDRSGVKRASGQLIEGTKKSGRRFAFR
jgi:hypothetical protein